MAPWWAKLAAVEKDYNEAGQQVQDASLSQGTDVGHNFAEGGSWYLEAVDLIQQAGQDEGKQAFRRIQTQLTDLNSDKYLLSFRVLRFRVCLCFRVYMHVVALPSKPRP